MSSVKLSHYPEILSPFNNVHISLIRSISKYTSLDSLKMSIASKNDNFLLFTLES